MKELQNLKSLEDFLQRLGAAAGESETNRHLADYFATHYLEIPFMTAGEVAAEAKVSQASVSRFCMSLGFHGYSDLLRELQKLVREDITAPKRLRYATRGNRDDYEEILANEQLNIAGLREVAEQEAFRRLADKLATAPRVVLLSARMSATLLPYMTYVLNKMRDGVEEVLPHTPAWNSLPLRDPAGTQIVTIAFPRYPNILLSHVERLHDAGFSIAAVTDRVVSPVTQFADPVITVPVTTSSIFDVYGAPIVLLNLLLLETAKRIPGIEERLNRVETLEQGEHIYWNF
ncbi:transcriptional regulator, RpiR family protein [Kyrpidia spormannii]|uniref:Transcriptional regulator, RpiR family protein n=1 Tax=Kyrpidia spormannii TaxID=2055160 RepID=A0A2K8N2W7_9BACL|nr:MULTISPECIES: MurR/RpiR family transcriptional regulator [Kyrpidia]ATY83871.1 transcriptional regulator, RpiR family protein [Kyrpidia spormannii]MCL6577301.1 MurR/RpiR family transcriptional regulator [Kyrpidia sp.]HHY67638.1 MurR/RpiR family transcriptional regulator [Alicyclobacillus sp.]